MNASPTIICNMALDFIGAATIDNLDDAGDRSLPACKCRRFWPVIWQAVCRAHPWKCIAKQATLTQTGVEPLHTFSYSFILPADYLRMISMDRASRKYRVFGHEIQCNVSPAYIDYVCVCTDWSRYTADLVRCLYLNLAYELAYSLASNVEVADRVKAELEKFFLPLARMTDSVEGGLEELEAGTFTDMFGRRSSGIDEIYR